MDVEQVEDGVACTPHATATWAPGLPETLTPAIKKKVARTLDPIVRPNSASQPQSRFDRFAGL
jgi:hypothetical protein